MHAWASALDFQLPLDQARPATTSEQAKIAFCALPNILSTARHILHTAWKTGILQENKRKQHIKK